MALIGTMLFSGLKNDEGFRGDIYDDATGKQIVKGYTVKGNPTTGYGFALNKNPLTKNQALPILQDKCWNVEYWCMKNLPYWNNLSTTRQYAVANIVYQLGGDGWLEFTKANYYLKQGDYNSAHAEILASEYRKQSPARCQRMADIILTDTLPDTWETS